MASSEERCDEKFNCFVCQKYESEYVEHLRRNPYFHQLLKLLENQTCSIEATCRHVQAYYNETFKPYNDNREWTLDSIHHHLTKMKKPTPLTSLTVPTDELSD